MSRLSSKGYLAGYMHKQAAVPVYANMAQVSAPAAYTKPPRYMSLLNESPVAAAARTAPTEYGMAPGSARINEMRDILKSAKGRTDSVPDVPAKVAPKGYPTKMDKAN